MCRIPTRGNGLAEDPSKDKEECKDLNRSIQIVKQDSLDGEITYGKNVDKYDSEISSPVLKESTPEDEITADVSQEDQYNLLAGEQIFDDREHNGDQIPERVSNATTGKRQMNQTGISQENSEPIFQHDTIDNKAEKELEEYMTTSEKMPKAITQIDQSAAVSDFQFNDTIGQQRSTSSGDMCKNRTYSHQRNAERILRNSLEHDIVDEMVPLEMEENIICENATEIHSEEKLSPSVVLQTIGKAEGDEQNSMTSELFDIKGTPWRQRNAERILKKSIKQSTSAEEAEWGKDDDMAERQQVRRTRPVDSTNDVDHQHQTSSSHSANQEDGTMANLTNVRFHSLEKKTERFPSDTVEHELLEELAILERENENVTQRYVLKTLPEVEQSPSAAS